MRMMMAALVVAALLAIPLGLVGSASADTRRDLTPIAIGPVTTDRFGGGDLVAVKAGDTVFGVRYGTSDHSNNVVIFAEYKRFLGGAEIVDDQGNYLATRGIPVYTVLAQSLDRFIEFRTVNATDGYDLTSVDPFHVPLTENVPVKARTLTAAWQLSALTNETLDGVTYVNFTVGARDTTAEVPWYRVTVDDGNRYDITDVDFLGYKNVTGPAIGMGAKYDHLIEGWDFAYPDSQLALETHLLFGNYIPERTAQFIHEAFLRDHADDGNRTLGDASTLNETAPTRPHLYTRDRVYFDDDYTRIGRFEWATNVTVDGQPSTMTFNVQGGGGLQLGHGGAYFLGFWLRAAFVYPQGRVIEHDPVLATEAILDLPVGVNLTPLTILAAQTAVVALAMGPALYLRAKARRGT